MDERHDCEQYFFDQSTIDRLADLAAGWESPCCICCPQLGRTLVERNVDVSILDIDERFAHLPGFRHFDLTRPDWLGLPFGLIICDPPFFCVSLSQLRAALRTLARNDFSQPMLVSYLTRRGSAFEQVFDSFGLKRTGFRPGYRTVVESPKNEIEFWGNIPEDRLKRLR